MARLIDFIAESNRIEGIVPKYIAENYNHFLGNEFIDLETLREFTLCLEPDANLRDRPGMNVTVGKHVPMGGGIVVKCVLEDILRDANTFKGDSFLIHRRYETLHPFMDGNGRSGRALWLWMMGGVERVPLGFLHTWYYQSLQFGR